MKILVKLENIINIFSIIQFFQILFFIKYFLTNTVIILILQLF